MHIFKTLNTNNHNSSAFEKIYITIFIWMLASCVFYPHGVEHARYAMIGLILIFFIRKKSELKNLCKSDSFLALLSFFTIALMSLLLNPAPLSRIDEVANWIAMFISGYVASAITQDKNFKFILVIPIALLGAVIIYPVLSGAGGSHLDIFSPKRLTLYFHQRANHLGLICGSFAFALSYIGTRSSGKIRALYFFLSCVCFFLLFRTSARTSFLGTVTVFSGWLLWQAQKMRKRIIFLFIISIICAATLLLCSPLKNNRIISSATTGIAHDISFLERFFTWNVAYTNFKERPIIGWGFDTFGEQYAEEMKKYKNDQEYQKSFLTPFPRRTMLTTFSCNFSLKQA
jgi:O-antigen ligase